MDSVNINAESIFIPGDLSYYIDNMNVSFSRNQVVTLLMEAEHEASLAEKARVKEIEERNNKFAYFYPYQNPYTAKEELANREARAREKHAHWLNNLNEMDSCGMSTDNIDIKTSVFNFTRNPITVSQLNGITTTVSPLLVTGYETSNSEELYRLGFPKNHNIAKGVYYRYEFSVSALCLMKTIDHYQKRGLKPNHESIEGMLLDYFTNRWNDPSITVKIKERMSKQMADSIKNDFCTVDSIISRWLERETTIQPVFTDVFFIFIPEGEFRNKTVFDKNSGLTIANEAVLKSKSYNPYNENNVIASAILEKMKTEDSLMHFHFVSEVDMCVYVRLGNQVISKHSRKPKLGEQSGMTIIFNGREKWLNDTPEIIEIPIKGKNKEENEIIDKRLEEIGIFYDIDKAKAYMSDAFSKFNSNEANMKIAQNKERVSENDLETKLNTNEKDVTIKDFDLRAKIIDIEAKLADSKYKTIKEVASLGSIALNGLFIMREFFKSNSKNVAAAGLSKLAPVAAVSPVIAAGIGVVGTVGLGIIFKKEIKSIFSALSDWF